LHFAFGKTKLGGNFLGYPMQAFSQDLKNGRSKIMRYSACSNGQFVRNHMKNKTIFF